MSVLQLNSYQLTLAGSFSFFNPGIFLLIDTTSLLIFGWNLPTDAVEIFATSTAVFNYNTIFS